MKKLKQFLFPLLCGILLYAVPVQAHDWATTYLYGGTNSQYEAYVKNTGGVLDNVCPDYFELNADGSLRVQKIDAGFITSMHNQGVRVTPFLTNNFDRALGITAINNREALADQIAECVYAYNLDGVDIDVENLSEQQRDVHTDFIRLLRERMPDKQITVAVAANPYNWTLGWQGSYDYTSLAKYCDYLLIMGYDESYTGSEAGPVASSSFVEKSIQYALSKTTADKLVLGMPFYGRYWKEGSSIGGYGVTAMDIESLMKNYTTTKVYLPEVQTARVTLTLTDSDIMPRLWGGRVLTPGTYEIWYDDLTSLQYKLDLIEKYKLHGSGSWAMGQENTAIWSIYQGYKTAKNTAPSANQALIEDFITRLYRLVLGRGPDSAGLAYWVNLLKTQAITGVDATHGFFMSTEFTNKKVSDSDYIELLYKVLLNRSSDSDGKAYWLGINDSRVSRKYLLAGFANSTEFRQLCESYGILQGTYRSDEARDQNQSLAAFVTSLYRSCLGREPDVDGLNYWTGRLYYQGHSAAATAQGFYFSQEFASKSNNAAFVDALYKGLMSRNPDAAGRAYWLQKLNSGVSRKTVFDGFINSTEFTNLCNRYGIRRS